MPETPLPDDPVTAYALAVEAGTSVASRLVHQACRRHLDDVRRQAEKGLEWRPAAAQLAIDFFAEVLFLPENTDADEDVTATPSGVPQPFLLQKWQQFIVGSLFGWYTTQGFRRFRSAYIETAKGSGKALALDTPIPTPTGWTTMGAIQPGDMVFDAIGHPSAVLGVSDVMDGHECFEVVFDDGSKIVADAEHLWWTEMRRSAYSAPGDATRGVKLNARGGWRRGIRTTEDILATLRYSNGKHQSANHSVPLAAPLGTPSAPLPIEPYVFGVWLGDGDSDCARITVADADAELLEHVAACGVAVGSRRQSIVAVRAPRYRLGGSSARGRSAPSSLNATLRRHGLLDQPKHIPTPYLRSAVDQRLALLQGLMDTDGYINPANGACEFCSTSEPLARGVRELLVSLGIKCSMIESAAKIYGREVSRRWRIAFHPPTDMPVFRLRRKLAHQRSRHNRRRLSGDRRIVDVRPVASVPVKCIAVDSPSHLYLAGDAMIPTHNTPLGAGIMLYLLVADGEKSAQVFLAAVSREQANYAWRDCRAMVKASPELVALFGEDGLRAHELIVREDESFLRPVSSETRGLDGKRVHGALVDELHEHATAIVVNKMQAGTKGRRNALIVKTTNSGFDRTSVCWNHHEHSRKVLDGTVVNETWFAFIAGLDPCETCVAAGRWFPSDDCATCDDWQTEGQHWLKANPNLGVSLPWQYVRERVAQAKSMPSEVSDVLRFNFCVWTQGSSRAIDMGRWASCAEMPAEEELVGADCFGCLDLGESDDFSAWGRLWALADGRVAIKFRYYLPQVALERYPNRPYAEWKRAGLLTVHDGDATDLTKIRMDMLADHNALGMKAIFYDKRFARETAQILMGEGVDMVPLLQGFALSEALKRLLLLIATGDLCHGRDPILAWMASNTVVVKGADGQQQRIDKERSPDKIDGIAALIMGIEGALIRRERVAEPEYQLFFVGPST